MHKASTKKKKKVSIAENYPTPNVNSAKVKKSQSILINKQFQVTFTSKLLEYSHRDLFTPKNVV